MAHYGDSRIRLCKNGLVGRKGDLSMNYAGKNTRKLFSVRSAACRPLLLNFFCSVLFSSARARTHTLTQHRGPVSSLHQYASLDLIPYQNGNSFSNNRV